MWIGTKDKQIELPMFLQGAARSVSKWESDYSFVNGGGGLMYSGYGQTERELSWGPMTFEQEEALEGLITGRLGLGYIYVEDITCETFFLHIWPRLILPVPI